MTDFEDRIEGEIKTHEKEMIRKAIISKYGSKDLADRIKFVISTYEKDNWTPEEMFAKLTELGLQGKDTPGQVADALTDIGTV